MTIHIGAKKEEIASKVILFGDPVRTKLLAHKFLEDCKEVSAIRGALYFTGKYKGKEVTFGTSGMGHGSMGIYSFELFNSYNVEKIIRVGTSGGYASDMNLGDIVMVSESVTDDTSFATINIGVEAREIKPSVELNDSLQAAANKLGYKIRAERTHSTNVFYWRVPFADIQKNTNTACVEMESFALFVNATRLNRKAACLVVITDVLGREELEIMTPEEREKCCDKALEIALDLEV